MGAWMSNNIPQEKKQCIWLLNHAAISINILVNKAPVGCQKQHCWLNLDAVKSSAILYDWSRLKGVDVFWSEAKANVVTKTKASNVSKETV